MRFKTTAIHKGQEPDAATGAVIVPVYQTSTFRQEAIGTHKGYEYSRTGNPTRAALESSIAALEAGKFGLAFASGVAATSAVLSLLKKGDQVVAGDDMYGGTYRLLERVFKKWGIAVAYADVDRPQSFAKAMTAKTRLVWLETPTNPLLKIVDIALVARLAHRRHALLAVDNTFASPYLQNPLAWGADMVVHSTTKYLAGHSDIIGGAVVVNDEALWKELRFYQNAAGAVPGPWDCWLTLRGIKTLAVRMQAHEQNALRLARFLARHPAVDRVYYPGLKSFPGHALARRQMRGFGGMVSLELKGGFAAVEKFIAGLTLFTLAESLGGVESLVCYPTRMTHGAMPPAERLRRGIRDNLVRLSVGIEDGRDLQEDLANALRLL